MAKICIFCCFPYISQLKCLYPGYFANESYNTPFLPLSDPKMRFSQLPSLPARYLNLSPCRPPIDFFGYKVEDWLQIQDYSAETVQYNLCIQRGLNSKLFTHIKNPQKINVITFYCTCTYSRFVLCKQINVLSNFTFLILSLLLFIYI